jgi:hypothetical protein
MVIVANEPPYSVCIGKSVVSDQLPATSLDLLATDHWQPATSYPIAIPVPAREAREELNTFKSALSRRLSALSQKLNPCKPK